MASIHKDPRGKSPFWYCAFSLPNGKRVFRSTKLKDRDAAMTYCLALAGASKKAVQRNLPEEQARKLIDDIRKLSGEDPLRFRSVKDYTAEWLGSKETTASKGTQARYKGIMEEFVDFLGKRPRQGRG